MPLKMDNEVGAIVEREIRHGGEGGQLWIMEGEGWHHQEASTHSLSLSFFFCHKTSSGRGKERVVTLLRVNSLYATE